MRTQNKQITVDDVLNNPQSFGLPDFESFSNNPKFWIEKFYGRKDELFGAVDKGSSNLSRHVRKHIFQFKKWKCKSLEEMEVIVKDHGLDLDDLDIKPRLINMEGDKCDILVEFVAKEGKEQKKIIAPY